MTLGAPKRLIAGPIRGPIPWRQWTPFPAVGSITDDIPTYRGTHVLYEWLLSSDAVATSALLQLAMCGDLTATNYHNQTLAGSNGAASVPERQLKDCATIAAAQAVAGYSSSVFAFFPFAFDPTREKVCVITFTAELAALNQIVGIASHKRQGGSASPALISKLTQTVWSASAGNLLGRGRRAVVM